MTRARSAERTQFLHDIMSTAIEGGVGYWSIADDINRSGTEERREDIYFDWVYESYTLYCFDGDTDPVTFEKIPGECALSTKENPIDRCPGHEVTPETIARGLGLGTLSETAGNEKKIGWHYSQRKHVILANRENDGGEIDAGDADCIVQLGIFGKVLNG